MNNFSDYWKEINFKKINSIINNKNYKDVKYTLSKNFLSLEDIITLLSPSASFFLEEIAEKAKLITRNKFGNIINLYMPLYLSNLCSNECTYCGFSISNKIKRKILNTKEIINECLILKNKGIDTILIVTGEHKNKVGIKYFSKSIPIIRNFFSSLLMEVQPMSILEYKHLKKIGVDGILIYQETYDIKSYKKYHLKGKKKDFFWRLDTPDRIAQSGIYKIGLGILIGLTQNWRLECFILAYHLNYLRKKYWRMQYSISFPRIRPTNNLNLSYFNITEKELIQIICIFRLFAPEIDLSISTRESPKFRNNIINIAINNISAESKTKPGGYSNNKDELQQFIINDDRSLNEISNFLLKSGLQPIYKDWDNYLPKK